MKGWCCHSSTNPSRISALRPACGRRRAGCRRARPGGGARAGGCRPSAGRGSCGRRSCASFQETDSGSALDSIVRRPQPQALASSSSPPTWRFSKPASRSRRRRSAGAKACTSTSPSSAVALGLLGLGDSAGLRPDQAPPGRRHEQARPLRQRPRGGRRSGRARRQKAIAPAGAQDAAEFGEGTLEVGDVVQDRVAEDEVEALVLEGQLLGLGLRRSRPRGRGPRRSSPAASASPARCRWR